MPANYTKTLLGHLNADGGWPYDRGRSWTEPTALSLLALQAERASSEARTRAACWLARRQLADGGWPPCDSVAASTWVTSLALLALAQQPEHRRLCAQGLDWLLSHIYPDLTALQNLLQRGFGVAPSQAPGSSPWFPGTAGWIIPTSFAVLALFRWARLMPDRHLDQMATKAQNYLLTRRCPDGGWNHGGSLQRSEASTSYAETTGLALLALSNCASSNLSEALHLAEQYYRQPDSSEGLSWIIMGLAAHGRNKETTESRLEPRTPRDIALRLIASHAVLGQNPLIG